MSTATQVSPLSEVRDFVSRKHESNSLLGWVCSWDTEKAGKDIEFAKIKSSLTTAGLDEEFAQELSPRSAFSRACKDLKTDRVIRKVDDHDKIVKFQFTQEYLSGGQFEYLYEAFLELDKDTGSVSCTNTELGLLAKQLLDKALAHRTASDITRMVQKMFTSRADLYPINSKGVAYFVSQAHVDFIEKVEQFLHALGGRLSRFPVPKGDTAGDRSVRAAITDGLEDQIKSLDDVVEQWDDSTRSATFLKKAEAFKSLRFKIECHRDFLQDQAEQLDKKLGDAVSRMMEKINALSDKDSA